MIFNSFGISIAANLITPLFAKLGKSSDKQKLENRLGQLINSAAQEYELRYPLEQSERAGVPFTQSHTLFEQLLSCRLFGSSKELNNEQWLLKKLSGDARVVPPSSNELSDFFALFDELWRGDSLLRELEIEAGYKEAAINASELISRVDREIHQLGKKLQQVHSGVEEIDRKVSRLTPGETQLKKELNTLHRTPKSKIIGREKELQQLRTFLVEKGEAVLLNGMGGIGKTTLASVYLNEYQKEYDHLVWLTVDTGLREAILEDAILLKNLGVEHPDPEMLVADCLNTLSNIDNDKPLLLVLDNAEESLMDFYQALPKFPSAHLLITSRQQLDQFTPLEIDFLEPEQALQLFCQHNQNYTSKEVKELVEAVEFHTLAIELLARSSAEHRWEFKQTINAIRNDGLASVNLPHNDNKKVERIKEYLVSIFQISSLSKEPYYLLQQFIFLPNSWIPYSFLSTLLQQDKLPFSEKFSSTLSSLHKSGFLQYEDQLDSYKLHPVLAEALQPQLRFEWADISLLSQSIQRILSTDEATENPVDKFRFIPFGEAFLTLSGDEWGRNVSTIRNNLSLVYKDLGEYEKARDHLEAALESARISYEPGHPKIAISQSNLAHIYYGMDESGKACILWKQAHETFRGSLGEHHPHTKAIASFLQDLCM